MQLLQHYTHNSSNFIQIFLSHISSFPTWTNICCNYNTFNSNILNNPSIHNQIFLVLWHLFNISLIIQKFLILILNNIIWCINIKIFLVCTSIKLYNWFKELFWWITILDFNLIEFYTTFFTILGVVGFVDVTFIKQKFDNVNVLSLKFKLLIIIFELYNIRSIIWNFICIFSSPIETKKIYLKIRKKLFLIICVKCIHIIFSISFLYAAFKEPKHFTSRGWRIWNEWKSI